MALTQPILNAIAAFDATQEHIFSFVSIGGDQVTGCQLTVYDNETNVLVYQGNYTSFKFEFPLAANTLTNGKYYNATISTINNASEFSEPSNPVAFYCYTEPVLTITNIPVSGTIEQSNYTFEGNYVQSEGELLNGYQYTLYDSNKEKISQSDILYDGLYQHTFSGMANDTSYYVELSGSTVNNTQVSSGLLLFTIRYIQPASFAICDLVNNCQNGFIQISSNIVSIDGITEPDPPKYIDNKEIDLTDNGSWVEWNDGFNIQNDFTMRIWGRSFKDNEPIVIMKNELDTDSAPNRIEMKFMVTSIIDSLPNYIFASNDIVTTESAVNEPITDLGIGGNGYQKVTDSQPTPTNSSPVNFTGDIGNQINIPDTSVSYEETMHVTTKPNNNYVLLPNRIYTLNFDYIVTNSTTDIYYGVGYGTQDSFVKALEINGSENLQYTTQNRGSNSITFQTPATFEGVDTPYLWIEFAKTIISATVSVDISNVSLYFGEYTEYQLYGRYNIPFKILGQNLFNYQKLQYFIDNNTTHEVISNGYSINPTVVGEQSDISIGYTNNLVAGAKYRLSYQTLGDINDFKFYKVEKGTSEIVEEIELNDGVFTAPENAYDFMLKFDINSESLTNNVNIWNIQIVEGEEELDYAPYTEKGLNMSFEQPLRGIGDKRDYILLETINLINPTTLRANVKENTTYYFSNNTSNSYLLDFYNAEDHLIESEDITKGSFTTPANCKYIKSEDFTASDVISKQLQIEEGNTFTQYFPYIEKPSVIRNIGTKELSSTENWQKSTVFDGSFYQLSYLPVEFSAVLCNYVKDCGAKTDNEINSKYKYGTLLNRGGGTFGIWALQAGATVQEFKDWLAKKKENGNPVMIYYELATPLVYDLSGEYAKELKSFATELGTNNIMIDSQYPGYLRLKYANSYTDQETKSNYVILKCWNENTMPYMVHSNYIKVNSPKDKIFIWTRRKNNIFDLKIENLGEE